ncbi:hypothetical protein [Empedobacter sedimenti]|uniref:hypothetical protein n=1 Tax=Empedobacter sedimenti TaxID=3042610 RepID=UPI0024A6A3AA|nr:hypothetical protein [Empedobacter sedimenti]
MDKYSFDLFVKEKPKKDPKSIVKMILSFIAVSIISYVFLELNIFKNQTYYYIFIGVLATIVAYLNGFFKKPEITLDGKIDGKLTFTNDGIQINDQFYPIKDLYSVIIENNDYVGKKVKEFGEFELPNGSHGVSNLITIKTKSNQFVEANFKQNKENEFAKMEAILINYFKHQLLSEEDLVEILKLEHDIDKRELNKKLK